MWIIFAVLTVLMWGSSDVFFKKASSDDGSVTSLIIYNGVSLFAITLLYMICTKTSFNFDAIIRYAPVSLCYIASMFAYYAAFKFAKVSIVSPVGNASCAITSVLCIFFLGQKLSLIQMLAIIVMITSIIVLSINSEEKEEDKRKIFMLGIVLALLYTLLDGIGSFLDELYIDTYVTRLSSYTENDVIVSMATAYGLVAIMCLIYKVIKNRKRVFNKDNISNKKICLKNKIYLIDKMKLLGTLFETVGEYTYIYTYANADAAIASPFIASFCVVSIILSRIFLKEKITRKQYILVAIVIAGMFILSIE